MRELENLKPKDAVKKIQELLQEYIDIPLIVSFSKHSSSARLKDIRLAKVTELNNKPAKRDGKTPSCVLFTFDCFRAPIIIEDIENIVLGLGRVQIQMAWGSIEIKQCK